MTIDYKSFKPVKNMSAIVEERQVTMPTEYWWASDKDKPKDLAENVIDMGRHLEQNSQDRHQANIRHARLYENTELNSLTSGGAATRAVRMALFSLGVITLNVVAAAIDTLAAKIAKNKPRPMFTTSGGNWKQQRAAKKLDKWARGLFHETQIYRWARRVFIDAGVFGTGALHVFFGEDKRLCVERVIPDELFVDDSDGLYGNPVQLFRKKLVHKVILASSFPRCANEIMSATSGSDVSNAKEDETVEVWEAWKRGATDAEGKESPGRHVIAIDNCVLLDEPMGCRFPFVFLRGKDRLTGFWGKGDAEALIGLQLELNRLIQSISEQLRRKGRGRIYVPMGSKVEPGHLTNGIADIIKYSGNVPPTVDNGNVVSQDEFAQVDRIYERALQEVGVSALSAAAKKPSGLDAAVALREYSEIESERFSLRHLDWEQFFLDFTEIAIELVQSRKKHGYKVKVPGRRKAEMVDFSDIDLDRDSYVIQMFPVSSLPQTPAARFQRVQELLSGGFISMPVARRLLDFPDLEAEGNLGNAALDDVDSTISKILDEETAEYEGIDPMQDIQLLAERALAAYLYAKNNGAEEERLELMRRLINDATQALTASAEPAPAMPENDMLEPPPGPPMPGMAPEMAAVPPPAAPPPAPGI